MKQKVAHGIVLARTDYGEADRIVTFLTPEAGKVRVMAKGVRRPKSKMAGAIELFSVSEISYIQGRGDLHTLVSGRLTTHYGNIVKDIDRTMFGYELLKIINKALEDEGGEDFYNLVVSSLGILDEPTYPAELAEASFLLRLMQLLGHLPNFTHTSKGEPLPGTGNFQFSFDDTAFFASDNGPFTLNHIKLLRLLSHNDPKQLLRVEGLSQYLHDLTPLVRQMSRQYVVSF